MVIRPITITIMVTFTLDVNSLLNENLGGIQVAPNVKWVIV